MTVRPRDALIKMEDVFTSRLRLAKNTAQLTTLFALSNLWMVRRQLLPATGEMRP